VRRQEEIDSGRVGSVASLTQRHGRIFGEQLDGYVFSSNGWVQSYGSRYVKPPICLAMCRARADDGGLDSLCPKPDQKSCERHVARPFPCLQWWFVRETDQPRSSSGRQSALAVRAEVLDLESAGVDVVQIDEPAIREGLPLRDADRQAYLGRAVGSFRLSYFGVKDSTQIHTHPCATPEI
jgi:5-methyltetrahydropteroyltriglutamate--homocysteine methyltransferase